jgi:hypothetical protein
LSSGPICVVAVRAEQSFWCGHDAQGQRDGRELRLLPRDTSTRVLTTMFDYYAFPADAPGMTDHPRTLPHDRVRHVESALVKVVGDHRSSRIRVLHEIGTSGCGKSRQGCEWINFPPQIALRQLMFRIMPPRPCGISYGCAHAGTCD